jgi:DoxX-like family
MTNAEALSTAFHASTNQISRTRLWTGRVLTGLVGAFCIMDGAMKLAKPAFVVQATKQLGYPESTIVGIGVALLVCTLLYLIPRTSILGAVLLTGYLGGAVATNVRAEQPLFNIVFPVIFACMAWGGLWLRESWLKELLPVKTRG